MDDPQPGAAGAASPSLAGCRVVTASISARLLLAGQLRRLTEIRWSVVCGDEYPDPPSYLTVYRIPMARELAFSDLRSLARLYRFFRRHRFSFVQTHTPKASMLALPAARCAGLPTLYTMHGSMVFRDNSRARNVLGWMFERWCCLWAHRVLVQSREDADMLPKARICRAEKVVSIGNGIDLERFKAAPLPSTTGTRPVVMMVSRLVAEKGCRDFFAVAQALRTVARFVHVGPVERDQRDAISEEERRAATRSGGVEFVGEVPDVRPFIASSDIVMLPSYREGIPRAAMEAAAMGRPVVAYDIRGVREVIPGSAELLVPLGDVAALTARVKELLASPEDRARRGRLCAQAVQPFSEPAVVARLEQAYAVAGIG